MQGELQSDVLKVMTKKFSTSAKVWLAAIQGCVRLKDVPAAQAWLERSTKALPQRKHIKVQSISIHLTRPYPGPAGTLHQGPAAAQARQGTVQTTVNFYI